MKFSAQGRSKRYLPVAVVALVLVALSFGVPMGQAGCGGEAVKAEKNEQPLRKGKAALEHVASLRSPAKPVPTDAVLVSSLLKQARAKTEGSADAKAEADAAAKSAAGEAVKEEDAELAKAAAAEALKAEEAAKAGGEEPVKEEKGERVGPAKNGGKRDWRDWDVIPEGVVGAPLAIERHPLIIPAGTAAILDESLYVSDLVINGELFCPDGEMATAPLEINATSIMVHGLFQCGTTAAPYFGKLTISLAAAALDPTWDSLEEFRQLPDDYRGIMVMNGGTLTLTGDSRRSGWARLNQTAEPGDTVMTVDQNVASRWEIGDTIAIASTSYSQNEAERFVITGIQTYGMNAQSTVSLDHSIEFRHWGTIELVPKAGIGTPQPITLDQRAEVVNLTRNIVIKADESTSTIADTAAPGAELGGHVMVMHGSYGYIDSVEFSRMGQAGILGRYPFHWHIAGNVDGQYIVNSSVHDSFQRCITVHRTDFATVHNNSCVDFKGHGFFLEDGNEKNNYITHNIGFGARRPYVQKRLLISDIDPINTVGNDTGRFPSTSVFWISNPSNYVTDNVAAGSVGTGFWMAFHSIVYENDGVTPIEPVLMQTLEFSRNTAHSAEVGMTWDGAPSRQLGGEPPPTANNPNNPCDTSANMDMQNCDKKLGIADYVRPDAVFYDLVAYKNLHTGIYFRGQDGTFDNAITADNGYHFWFAYNQVLQNSYIVARSENFSAHEYDKLNELLPATQAGRDRIRSAGIVFYDGPFTLDNVQFLKYPTAPETFRIAGYPNYDTTPVPIGQTGGTEAFINVARATRFKPQPVLKIASSAWGNTSFLRDLDGTFTGSGVGSLLVSKNSTGILPTSNCQATFSQYPNMAVCPAAYTEATVTTRDNNWSTLFIARRDDGVMSRNDWNNALYGGDGTHFALSNSASHDFALLYNQPTASIQVGAESAQAAIPVIRILKQRSGCHMVAPADAWPPYPNPLQVNSLAALRVATESAYYSNGNEFYVKLVPDMPAWNANPVGLATPVRSRNYAMPCSSPPVPQLLGEVTSVQANADQSVTVKGYACWWGNSSLSATVKLFAGLTTQQSSTNTHISTGLANTTSNDEAGFACGDRSLYRGFQFDVTAAIALANSGATVRVYAVGTSLPDGGVVPDLALQNSAQFTFP